jgi:hypothetical protein
MKKETTLGNTKCLLCGQLHVAWYSNGLCPDCSSREKDDTQEKEFPNMILWMRDANVGRRIIVGSEISTRHLRDWSDR